MRREKRLVSFFRQDHAVVALELERHWVFAVRHSGNARRQSVPCRVLVGGFLAQHNYQHLVRRQQPHGHLPELVGADRAGLQQLEVQLLLLGKLGKHGLHHQPQALLLDQPGLSGINHFLRHSRQRHWKELKAPLVILVVGPHIQEDRAPLVRFHERQHVERGYLRSKEFERRPRFVLLQLLLEHIRIAEDLQPLFVRRRKLGHGRPGNRRAQHTGQQDHERPPPRKCLHEKCTFYREHVKKGRNDGTDRIPSSITESNTPRTGPKDRRTARHPARPTVQVNPRQL